MTVALTKPTGQDLNQFLTKQQKALDNRVCIETTDGEIHWSRYFTVFPGVAGNGPYHVGKYQPEGRQFHTPFLSSRDIVRVFLPRTGEKPSSPVEKISTDAFSILLRYLPKPSLLRVNCHFDNAILQIRSRELKRSISENTEQNPMGIEEYRMLRQLGIASFPEIHHLRLGRYCILRDASINDAKLKDILERFPNLLTLNIDGLYCISNAGLQSIADLNPKLESFSFKYSKEISLTGIQAISSLPLQSLDLSMFSLENAIINDACMTEIAKISTLQHLNISECRGVTDEGIHSLKSLRLRSLNIGGCNNVNDEGIRIIIAMPHLEMLIIGSRYYFSRALTEELLLPLTGHPLLKVVNIGGLKAEAINRFKALGIPIVQS